MAVRFGAAGCECPLAAMSLTRGGMARTSGPIDADLPARGKAIRRLSPAPTANRLALVGLTAADALPNDLPWQGADDRASCSATTLTPVTLAIGEKGQLRRVTANRTATGAIGAKPTIMTDGGSQALPACLGDKDGTLLAGEARTGTMRHPTPSAKAARVTLRGGTVTPTMEKDR